MNEVKSDMPFGLLLRDALKEQSLSMRKLSELTGIDTASISRIINDKRKANLDHLEKFSIVLDIPIAKLLEAAGYPVENRQDATSTYDDSIQELLSSSELLTPTVSVPIVEKKLAEYNLQAQTYEGQDKILTNFDRKLESVGSIGPLVDQMKELFDRFRKKKGNPGELAIMGSALLYFIVPTDVIPDYLFAVGYLDDAVAVQLTSSILKRKHN